MQLLLKYTYLMDLKKIKKRLDKLWDRYQEMCDKPNWEDLNEARAILYLTGNIYCEKIAPEAIERRLHLLKKPMSLIDFLIMVDSEDENLPEHRKDELFARLEKYYQIIKKYKNKYVSGKFYLEEEKFIKLYNKHNPDKKLKIKEKGRFSNYRKKI